MLSRATQPAFGSAASNFDSEGRAAAGCEFGSFSCRAFLLAASFFAKSLNDILAFLSWQPGYPAACEP